MELLISVCASQLQHYEKSLAEQLFDSLYEQPDKAHVRETYLVKIKLLLTPLLKAAEEAGKRMASSKTPVNGAGFVLPSGVADCARKLYKLLHDDFNTGDTVDRHYIQHVRRMGTLIDSTLREIASKQTASLTSTSATHDRSKPTGVSLLKIKVGDKFKNEPSTVALDKGVAVRKGSKVQISKMYNQSRNTVSLSKAELLTLVAMFK